ncbi:signal peptidase I [Syntrophobotulus glycolicus DSM 8271]|uniref:Signal peptidase I n=1 Tax=Syntrophobotulus glycolicus (strain DSM 8271 / FlGlyR) TaxID=645991 RepID=F0SZH2_SYNGF|nr:signal peptidase I [Syntrophobotulus glycolicus]ADY56058.1 signal peptidase I [Syntrophobotulus glycolicus DSM 8271]
MLKKTTTEKSFLTYLSDIIEISLILFALSWVLKTYCFGLLTVEDQAMQPTLPASSMVAVYKGPDIWKRGEIVSYSSPDNAKLLIKRVIGLSGDTVEIRNGLTFINNQPLYEPYQPEKTTFDLPAVLVPENHIFVMNDNRHMRDDSRFNGLVETGLVQGKVLICYWPLSKIKIFL